jgi:hypothetical protein
MTTKVLVVFYTDHCHSRMHSSVTTEKVNGGTGCSSNGPGRKWYRRKN